MDKLLHMMLDNTQEMALLFGSDGCLKYANRSAVKSLEYGDGLYGCAIYDIFPEIMQDDGNAFYSDGNFDGRLCEMNAYRRNKTCFPVVARWLRTKQDTGYFFCCLAYDATEQRLNERSLIQVKEEATSALKVKSEFVANVTHELRTPVNGILGNTRELMEMENDPKKQKLLGLLERGCRDMNSIINNILDFSKLEANKFTLEKREFNFREMMEYVKANHANKITEKGLDFSISISPQIPETIVADELRIAQILNNLLSNACKFTAIGKISVEVVKTAHSGNKIELFFLVMDTGIGMDKTEQARLFKSFSQVDASISRRYGGTGLGLNISKQLVELMGGNIRVESEKNKGSMFSFSIWVELPAGDNTAAQSTAVDSVPVIYRFSGDEDDSERRRSYGAKENIDEIRKCLSKLILAVDMENWEKAEVLSETIKELTEEAPAEVKRAVLKLKMSVQKGDYDKTSAAHAALDELIHN